MLFVVHATLVAERSKETLDEMRRFKAHPGILVKAVYALYGRHDVLMIFEAEDENGALDFVLELRNRVGIIDTETALATDLKHKEET